MPGRIFIAGIIVFWLATTGWLFYRDLLPRLAPGEPPPFTIDLADEVSEQKIFWTLYQNGSKKGHVQTWVKYNRAENSYEINAVLKLWQKPHQEGSPQQALESSYAITPDGNLRGMAAKFTIRNEQGEIIVEGDLAGRVENRRFFPRLEITSPVHWKLDLQPVPVSHRGSVFNPHQPVNRIVGLAPGQRWHMPSVTPLHESFNIWPGKTPEFRFVAAHVLPEVQLLDRGFRKKDSCLVIEYTGDNIEARIWVRENDGLVLRQEVNLYGDTLVLQRE
jgi:hypothetical protein